MTPSDVARARPSSDVGGRDYAATWTATVDSWVQGIWGTVVPDGAGLSLLAVGGYGRRRLGPFSDLDLLLLHSGPVDGALVDRLWYPMWDAGFTLGHAVRTPKETLRLAGRDLATATGLLGGRVLAGDKELGVDLLAAAEDQWLRRSAAVVSELCDDAEQRAERFGALAFDLEPDLKDGHGGLRDADIVSWAAPILARHDRPLPDHQIHEVAGHADWLLAVRIELQRSTGRADNRLLLQEQDDVATRVANLVSTLPGLGLEPVDAADVLMHDVARRGGEVAWAVDDLRVAARSSGSRRQTKPASAPTGPWWSASLEMAREAADRRSVPSREQLAAVTPADAVPNPWPQELLAQFVALLGMGSSAIPVIESLERVGVLSALLPEFAHTRSLPQRNAYHHWTVDRHLLETVAVAALLTEAVERPDLLLLGAFFHDIGKGLPGDHSAVGMDLTRAACTRMGLPTADVNTVAALVEHHLLLPDVATRRDLDDPPTIVFVRERVGTVEQLRLLAALTEADSRATGPAAWSSWKAGLLRTLVARVESSLLDAPAGMEPDDGSVDPDEDDELVRQARDSGAPVVRVARDRIVVACADRPGLFSRVAGVLALDGLDVVEAAARSFEDHAIEDFRVASATGGSIKWDRVVKDLTAALDDRLALSARLAERARTYRRRRRSGRTFEPSVSFDNDMSDDATVIEVVGPDTVGLLHRVTAALAELGCDIRTAKVSTIGPDAVDSFYVRGKGGGKILDREHLGEIHRALTHAIEALGAEADTTLGR